MRKTFRKYCALGIAALALGLLSAPASAHCDFITGGGHGTTTPGPAKKNFGAHGGCKKNGPDAPFWGHVNYVDHFAGFSPSPAHFRSRTITAYTSVGPSGDENDPKRTGTRRICGTGTTNQPTAPEVDFRVEMTDNGEPGTSDMFAITLGIGGDVVYHAEFTLEGGNIQLHKPNPGAAGISSGGTCNI
jgi:hypothetical protein